MGTLLTIIGDVDNYAGLNAMDIGWEKVLV